jgi:predicted nuclease of predicted toxin-antitoxin system
MTVWLDAHLSPSLAPWLAATFGVGCVAVRDLGLRDALDPPIFEAARTAGADVMTKDADFAEMVGRLGPPPRVLWLRCGNTSNAALRDLLARELPAALGRLAAGDPLVELGASP